MGLFQKVVSISKLFYFIEVGFNQIMDGLHVGLESVSSGWNSTVNEFLGFDSKCIRGRILRVPCADILGAIIGLTDPVFNDKIVSFKMLIDIFCE